MNNLHQIKNTVKALNGDVYNLAGSQNASARQGFMTLLTGQKLPKSKCGVNALQNALCKFSGIEYSCEADKRRNLSKWATT